jgi:hypothetical protein
VRYQVPFSLHDFLMTVFSNIKDMCSKGTKLQDGLTIKGPGGENYWEEAVSASEFTWSLAWKTTKDSCDFDCESVFLAFTDSTNCKCSWDCDNAIDILLTCSACRYKEGGLLKNGKIETACGIAQYIASKTGAS